MGSTTPTYALPYPVGSDRVRDGDNAIQALAERVEAVLAASVTPYVVPTGVVAPYAGAAAPAGWVLCNGAAVARTGTFAALFAVIGTTYGAGDGSTTFNVPDMRSRFPVGTGQGTGLRDRPRGTAGGSEDQVAAHNHGSTGNVSSDHSHSGNTGGQSADHSHATQLSDRGVTTGSGTQVKQNAGVPGDGTYGASAGHTHAFTTGGISANHSHAVNSAGVGDGNTPAFLSVNYIIKT